MTLQELLDQADQDGTLERIAAQLGVDRNVARQGMAQLAPAVARGMQRNAGGLGDLLGTLTGGGRGGTFDGNAVLGEIFGSKDVSRNVAGRAASESGLDSSLLRRMLPLVATALVMWLNRGGATGGTMAPQAGGRPAAGGSALDALTSILDQNQDGSAIDDLLNMARRFF